MKRALMQFAVCLALLVLALLVGWVVGAKFGGLFGGEIAAGIGMLVMLPFVFMAWIDLGRALRRDGGKFTYPIGLLVGLPQVLVALAAICCGALLVSVHLWAVPVARWWMPPLGAAMCLFGIIWIRDALKKRRQHRGHQPNPLMQPTGQERPAAD